jgi:actin-like ATPase involved in cell morphogenesis
VPYTFSGFGPRSLVVRTVTNPALLANNLRQVVANVDANTVLLRPETLEDQLNKLVYSVRMALGAHAGNILRLVLGKGLFLVGGGILLGLLTSFLTVRMLQSQLWGCVGV